MGWKRIAASSTLTLALLIAPSRADPQGPHPRSVEVAIQAFPGYPGEIIVRLVDPSGEATQRALRIPEGEESVELGPVAEGTRVELVSPDLWAQSIEILRSSPDRLALRSWVSATITGSVDGLPTGSNLDRLNIRLLSLAEDGTQPSSAVLACPLSDQGMFSCPMPAGRWIGRFSTEGYAHVYTGLSANASGEDSVGALVLEPGKSLAARVVADGPALDLRSVKIELAKLGDRSGSLPLEVSSADRSGSVRFNRMPAGSYELRARHPCCGSTPAVVGVVEDEDVVIEEPLRISPPISVELTATPYSDAYGGDWSVRALNPESHDPAFEVSLRGGFARTPSVKRGTYILEVDDSRGNSFHTESKTFSHDRQLVELSLPMVLVDGTVEQDSEAVAAKIVFGGLHGVPQIRTDSDRHGRFSVVLPRPGEWNVDVDEPIRSILVRNLTVEVPQPDGDGIASVKIRIPETLIYGSVTDSQGVPVAGAPVQLLHTADAVQHRSGSTVTDALGSFEIAGMIPGPYRIWATRGDRTARPLPVHVTAGDPIGPLQLRLEELTEIRGTILDEQGARVGGARVLALPLAATGLEALAAPEATTDPLGAFALSLPETAVAVRLWVLAPGNSLKVTTLGLPAEEDVELRLDRQAGELSLPPDPVSGVGLVIVTGQPVDTTLLRSWAQLHSITHTGEQWSVPAMPIGMYSYCVLELSEGMQVLGGVALPKREACTGESFLNVGGILELSDPSR